MSRKRAAHGRRALVIGLFTIVVTHASATVTQVDGTILPVLNGSTDCNGAGGDNLQICFNTIEGVSPPNPNAIDQFLDAATVPEIFLPNTAQPVQFRDISEGAGFENSFGWYNIGDDVLTAAGRNANLHPIFGCGRPMAAVGNATTHQGNPAFYVQNAEPGAIITVDFAQEQTALRYKGGFIGFYLITPEGNPSNNNCGDFKNGSDGLSLFGFIYFTQKDLNNDGDFVHHLVYGSKITANRFYFGFEDLFRGGDNDFEDMLILVTGLSPPCVPQAEVCDGLDNDCDGLVDGNDPDLVGIGNACTCDGVALTCDNGPRFGQCQTGTTLCTAAEIVCHGTGTPSGETCNGLDDNCNNQIDDNPAGTGAACDGSDADLCPEGQIICQSGALVCGDNTGNNIEDCDGVDDDCDGPVDEGNPGGGGSCGSSIGVCNPGTLVCSGGGLVCQGATGGTGETCNGFDDDCNGVVDNNPSDAGAQCGATDEGECDFGQTICVGGSLSCAGEVGPSPETCNGLDDDCDTVIDNNPVDAGQPCGSSIGACVPGQFECSLGTLACTGGIGPTAEICNGVDDDCDAKVDEQVPGEGVACGPGMGPCMGGMTKCINGTMECVGGTSGGTETCNLIDDDCDGDIDEGDLCNGGLCDNGVCAPLCVPGEQPCQNGQICDGVFCVADPCFGVQCQPDAMGNAQACVDGVCEPLCNSVSCPPNLVCRGSDGTCVPDTCEYLPKCAANELCINSACVSDPCQGVSCPSDQFCREGACVESCEGVQCGSTQVCKDGACVETGCALECVAPQICNPTSGNCEMNPCDVVICPPKQACDPLSGQCIPDPCQGVTCPGQQACNFGQCGTERTGEFVTTGGGGGCSAGGDGGLGVALVLAALFLCQRAARRTNTLGVRRRKTVLLAALLASSISACGVNEYCLQCSLVGGDGDGGTGDGGTGGDSGDGGGPTCDPNLVRPETCNNADDDCDGTIDEGINLATDELNCGACGIECNKPGAQTICNASACTISGCFPGFNDVNNDIGGPYAASDGCEFMCFTSNGGVEACDTLDNNCNGTVDEGFDFTSDVNNCGQCNKVCEFFEATASCVASTCQFNPATDCTPGFVDINGNQADGCEYQCSITNGGVEACDVIDNNCNGSVDEGFNLNTDAQNCGVCGRVCNFANATASCTGGVCGFNPATDCDPGFVDADGIQVDGCEYACSPTNGGVERCDGIDNDCEGVADDSPVDAGGACSSVSPAQGACVANGTLTCASGALVCSGATEPATESCDNVDQDCDGTVDDGVTQTCYTGPGGTSGVGVCRNGTSTCTAGSFGACTGEVVPGTEACNNLDDDCDGTVDDGGGGGPIVQTCYSGPPATRNVGTCSEGNQTCAFGTFGTCVGEVLPQANDVCGDGADTDCDSLGDAGEGCLTQDAEIRLDAPGGGLGEATPNAQHSHDIVLSRGTGQNVYAAWSQRVSGVTEVYFRSSTNGGATWGTIINVTSGVAQSAVQPRIAVAPGTPDQIIVAYQTFTSGVRDIRVSRSTDGGATFGAASGALDASGDCFHHAVAMKGTTVVVAWEKLDTATLIRDVQSRVSTNSGATFGAEFRVNVNSPATRFAGRPVVGIPTVGGTDGIVWAWREQRSGPTRNIFAASVATVTGVPAADIRIDNDSVATPANENRESDFPVMVVNEANAYLAWQDVSTAPAGGSDIMFARSTNGGAVWGAERIIDDNGGEVSSSFTPTIAVDPRAAGGGDDLIAIAWEDRRQGTQVFASVSTNGGNGAFAIGPTRVSSDAGGPVTGATSVPVIAAPGQIGAPARSVLVVAYQNQQTNQNVHVFVATSVDNGATWSFTHDQIDGGGGNALLPAITPATVGTEPGAVVGWADFRGNQINGDVYVAGSH